MRPVVRSVESGSATKIPATSRPAAAADMATRANCSAVAFPADTPITVVAAPTLSGTLGLRGSTTVTITVIAGLSSGSMSPSPLTVALKLPGLPADS